MSDTNNSPDLNPEENEIDLLELAQKLWARRRKLIMWSAIGAVVALVVAFSIPKEYMSGARLAPEIQGNKPNGNLGALASMAGIQIGSSVGQDAVYPALYPEIVASVPFMTSLFDVKVKTSDDDPRELTVREYVMNDLRSPWWSAILGFPFKILGMFRSEEEVGEDHKLDNFHLTREEADLVEALQARVYADYDMKSMVVGVGVKMQDPLVAAMLADTVVSRLQEYITDYRTDKARQDLKYARQLEAEARQNYYQAQQKLADYVDHNQYLATQSAQLTRERLQNEASLAFGLYNQIAQQVQTAQARVQETTPVYAVVQPATVPIKAVSPRKFLILVGFTFLAFVACAAWILFGQPLYEKFRKGASANVD